MTNLVETSTIPAFQDMFVATIGALAVFTGVPVTVGAPDGAFGSTMIVLGDVAIDEQPVFLGTQQNRDETYEQDLYISVVNEGTSDSDPRSDAFAYRDAIAGQLKTDPTMGGTVIWAVMGGGQLRQPSNPTRREAVLRLVIRCKARI